MTTKPVFETTNCIKDVVAALARVRVATLAARDRLSDDEISTAFAKGSNRTLDVVRVQYVRTPKRKTVITHIAGPFSFDECVAYLDAMGR